MKGKIITCCGDCTYYDWKKHKCKNGYNKEENAQDKFYEDCNMFKDLEEHDKEIYNKAIDDYKNRIKEELDRFEVQNLDTCVLYDLMDRKAEQLKAGGKDNDD